MLESIKDSIFAFFEPLTSVIDFLIGIGEDLVYVVKLTGAFVVNMPRYFAWLPSPVVTLLCTIFSVVVIYKILGREG